MDFYEFFQEFDRFGLRDALFPFLLIFTIIFAILTKVKMFGKENKGANIVIAAIMALTTVMMHLKGKYPEDKDPVNIINDSLPIAVGVVVAILAFLFLISAMEGEANLKRFEIGSLVIGLAVLFFINFAFPQVPFWIALASAFILAWRGSIQGTHHKAASYSVTFIIIGIVYIFGSRAGLFGELPHWMQDELIQMVIIAVLVFLAVVMFISRGSGD